MEHLRYCFTLKTGSIASGLYTMTIQGFFLTVGLISLNPENEKINPLTKEVKAFTISYICMALIVVITSIVLLIGICAHNTKYLIPWMISTPILTILNLAMIIYFTIPLFHTNVITFVIFLMIDFIITILNIISLICVIALHQQYKSNLISLYENQYCEKANNENNQFNSGEDKKMEREYGELRPKFHKTPKSFLHIPDVDRRTSLSTSTTLTTDDSYRMSIDMSRGSIFEHRQSISAEGNPSYFPAHRNGKFSSKSRSVTFQDDHDKSDMAHPQISVIVESDSATSNEKSDAVLPKLETML